MTQRSTVPAPSDILDAYKVIVDYLRANTTNKDLLQNFAGTEERCARALIEGNLSDKQISIRLAEIIKTHFPVDVSDKEREGMITQGPISINSMCPHHLFPVRYTAFVSYLPKNGRVLGLSKLARIAKVLGQRPVLHEQLASDIADVLHQGTESRPNHVAFPGADSNGAAVQLTGVHTCMACRGVEEPAFTQVTELRGNFWEVGFESKFYQAVDSIKTSKVF